MVYRGMEEWTDGQVTIQIYDKVVDETNSYRCTKGILVVHTQDGEVKLPLWTLSGCE
jgi:hypothetical protein